MMITIFYTSISNPVLITLTVLFTITSAITVFDKRLIQAKRSGVLPPDEPLLPTWTNIFWWIHGIILVALIVLNWKYGILLFVIKFALSVLPVLETIGNILMRPFRPKQKSKTVDRTEMNVDDEYDADNDPLYEAAKSLVIAVGQASAARIQYRLRIGYARATRLLYRMEEDGIVSAQDGASPRKVLVTSKKKS